MDPELDTALRILAGALGGAAVGVERERSGHAHGPNARFAGVRTFTLLGGLAGLVGWLWSTGVVAPAAILLSGTTALVVVAYAAASRKVVEGTTEVAALVVLAAGFAAGLDHLRVASAVIAVTALLLLEKTRLHAAVARIDDLEMRAAARFAVMAIVILPLLPEGPFGPLGGVRPRALWILVLLFSGVGFAGWVARRLVGERGYEVAGLLGGLVSSTSVTLSFARASRREPTMASPLALGVLAASTVMYVRLLITTAIISPSLAVGVVRFLIPPAVAGAVLLLVRRRRAPAPPGAPPAGPQNPLAVWSAIQLALLFQLVLYGVRFVRQLWGETGLLLSGALLGVADTDALTLAMASSVASGEPVAVAARAVAVGAVANMLLKTALALALGSPEFRRPAAAYLGLVTAVAVAAAAL